MITISIDDQIKIGKEIVSLMEQIDPEGEHYAFQDEGAALEFIRTRQPQVVWLDVEMPEKSGLELAVDIKKASPQTNIVFVTGHDKFALPAYQMHPSGFVLKPVSEEALRKELDNLRFPVEHADKKALLRVQCFGNFEVFDREGNVVKFQRAKSKELFAYMIDRKGALCSSAEFCGALFEDRAQDRTLKNQVRVFLQKLKQDLEQAEAGEVLVKGWNANGVDCQKVDCDYYNF